MPYHDYAQERELLIRLLKENDPTVVVVKDRSGLLFPTEEDVIELAKALKDNTQLKELLLNQNNLTERGAATLAKVLKNTRLEELDLAQNPLGDDGVTKIVEHLPKTITKLDFSRTYCGDGSCEALRSFMKGNPSLESLELQGNNIRPAGTMSLKAGMEGGILRRLDLNNNQVGDAGAHILADGAKGNRHLTDLSLSNNGITNAGAVYFGESLGDKDTGLRYVNLSANLIGVDGLTSLADNIEKNHQLQDINLLGNVANGPWGDKLIRRIETQTKKNQHNTELLKNSGIQWQAPKGTGNEALLSQDVGAFPETFAHGLAAARPATAAAVNPFARKGGNYNNVG